MNLYEVFLTERLKTKTSQQAIDAGMFGPVYHGSSPEKLEKIKKDGFKVFVGHQQQGEIEHGYGDDEYLGTGFPPPIHHLGFGVYFTTVLAIAKRFNHGTVKGLHKFYLDVPNLEIINFASERTMMKWWMQNGYDINKTNDRLKSTKNLTKNLKQQYDAVWFKGKTLYRTLDGDQICVFDPKRIYMVDDTKAGAYDIGSKVKHIGRVPERYAGWANHPHFIPNEGVKGTIVNREPIHPRYKEHMKLGDDVQYQMTVKWAKGGTHYNYIESDLIPV